MSEILNILVALWLSFFPTASVPATTEPVSATTTATVLRVIDGDTIDVLDDGREFRVRYIGIDTPEPYAGTVPECFSTEASEANEHLVAGQVVTLVADQEDTDNYNRLLRYVYVEDLFVNAKLVEEGYATTLPIEPNTRHASRFYELQKEAKAAGLGLWSACE